MSSLSSSSCDRVHGEPLLENNGFHGRMMENNGFQGIMIENNKFQGDRGVCPDIREKFLNEAKATRLCSTNQK
ncbi:hypothetical protein DY000_02007359 [Brassica cretica]|uniref:Uncharacterized protein n=1 Tax=Brassica cretica TaxID=69181 RepID=A0ABQ7C9H1_BRACR|nr:hypothetical protein DY000_02007359 [Brassica cretica]